ncbi:hypothetical protein ACFY2K_43315 [Kitasatospora sp. NPDC001309]|uniref:hypothetical protein n=1 Tax=Kitasatospora sp. NPDC001309 TaxID=3364013 RepID=UPI0036A0F8D9
MTRTPEQIRAEAVAALTEPGAERLALMSRVAEVDEILRPLVRQAVAAGVPKTRVRELTGLARGTIGTWSEED